MTSRILRMTQAFGSSWVSLGAKTKMFEEILNLFNTILNSGRRMMTSHDLYHAEPESFLTKSQ